MYLLIYRDSRRILKSLHISIICFIILISFTLTSCSREPSKETIQAELKDKYSEQIRQKGAAVVCTKVILAKESKHKYTGFIELSNGEKEEINVIIDGSNYVYKLGR